MSIEAILITTTVADRADAERIAAALVAKQLVACVQVSGPVESTFHWKGQVETCQEWVCSAKTRRDRYTDVERAIRELHSYEQPEIIAVPIILGSPGYLAWISEVVPAPPLLIMTPFHWHVTVHARPVGEFVSGCATVEDNPLRVLAVPPADLTLPLPVSFETAYAELEKLPRMFIEPDGSWVWVSSDDERSWQLDGMLYDRGGKLLYMEIKGHAPIEVLRRFLACCGCEPSACVVQFARYAVVASVDEWFGWISQRSPARSS